jgi:hypothetical protein
LKGRGLVGTLVRNGTHTVRLLVVQAAHPKERAVLAGERAWPHHSPREATLGAGPIPYHGWATKGGAGQCLRSSRRTIEGEGIAASPAGLKRSCQR